MRLDDLGWVDYDYGTKRSPVTDLPLASLKQIHSARVIEAKEPGLHGEGDALISDVPGLAVGVKTADCIPILIADWRNRAVAAVHAGWRGAAKQILHNTLTEMRARFGTQARDVIATIGPGIGPCCFEVGPEVALQFSTWEPALEPALMGATAKSNLDLPKILRRQLMVEGVMPENMDCAELCTMCHPDLFFSYRRDKENAGRMLSWIALRAA